MSIICQLSRRLNDEKVVTASSIFGWRNIQL
jgi:hypothetical protein